MKTQRHVTLAHILIAVPQFVSLIGIPFALKNVENWTPPTHPVLTPDRPWRRPVSALRSATASDRGRVKTLSYGGAGVATRRRAPSSQALIASINGLVPSTAITRFML